MPHPCVVCGRSRMNPNNREEEYMFFGFPVNYDTRCKKWLEFCCREDLYKLTKKQLLQRMVCSKHFEAKDFLNEYQDRLNVAAVPSIYDPKQSLYNITCVLCSRSRRDPPPVDYDGTTFHHFPGEEFRCLKWLDFVGIDSYFRLTRKEILFCYICSNHFDKSQFVPGYKGRLVDNAVPNIRFPDNLNDTQSTLTQIEWASEPKLFHSPEKTKRYEPLTSAVLESQACAACGRSRSDPRNKIDRYKFHPFPAYEIGRCLRWCQFLGREDLLKMSPNQIRKLVLCSKHFLTGQSFHKVGPCDAVPTIKEITDQNYNDEIEQQLLEMTREDINDPQSPTKVTKRQFLQRPLVSSKKPKVENKPAPLAKKRGRSKRSTSINIPKIDNINIENRVRKLPLPPANWKIQIGNNQFQPLTLANANNANTITADGKKVILPFTGNISNLGAPIPVNSLSSMPPGFLIKINLPEQGKKIVGGGRRQKKMEKEKKIDGGESGGKSLRRRRKKKDEAMVDKFGVVMENHQNVYEVVTIAQAVTGNGGTVQRLDSGNIVKEELILNDEGNDERMENHSVVEEMIMEDDLTEGEIVGDMIEVLDDEYAELQDEDIGGEDAIHVYEEVQREGHKGKRNKEHGERMIMSSRARRSLLPIRAEVRCFLEKLKPHMRRLPRKARAQLKLSIVNLVIDRL